MIAFRFLPGPAWWRRPAAVLSVFLAVCSPAALDVAEPGGRGVGGGAAAAPNGGGAGHAVANGSGMIVGAGTSVRARWLAPFPGPLRVGRKFDPPQYRWLPGHRGVDLCAPVGSEVRAPREGVVVYAARLADRNVVSIEHSDGLRSTFEPVTAQVTRGQFVAAGQVVGTLEAGHEGDCLHWGVKRDRDTYLNPLLLLFGPVRLLPLDGD